jgi:hypothetical protein
MSMPASAAPSTATCSGSWKVTFAPGLGTTSQEVEFRAEGGTIHCLGAIDGSPVTGPGTLAEHGRILGTALAGTGSGVTTVDIPTTSGQKSISFAETLSYGPGVGVKKSDALAGPFIFTFLPTSGDGILNPVTEITVGVLFTLKG